MLGTGWRRMAVVTGRSRGILGVGRTGLVDVHIRLTLGGSNLAVASNERLSRFDCDAVHIMAMLFCGAANPGCSRLSVGSDRPGAPSYRVPSLFVAQRADRVDARRAPRRKMMQPTLPRSVPPPNVTGSSSESRRPASAAWAPLAKARIATPVAPMANPLQRNWRDTARPRSQRNANSDLMRALRNRIRDYAVQPHARENHRQRREARDQRGVVARLRQRGADG